MLLIEFALKGFQGLNKKQIQHAQSFPDKRNHYYSTNQPNNREIFKESRNLI